MYIIRLYMVRWYLYNNAHCFIFTVTVTFFILGNVTLIITEMLRKCSLHHKDKPWIPALLKNLIHGRNRHTTKAICFIYCFLRNKDVEPECKKA